jgi:diguanylate cyclase (GGDEF)-like protein/PAS domain S-box-containing protein
MFRVLVITNNKHEAKLLQEALGNAITDPFRTHLEKSLAKATQFLELGRVDIILLDLTLPDSTGLLTFDTLLRSARRTPIMTLTDRNSLSIALETVQRGSQGYLFKGQYDNVLLPQSLRNVIERRAAEEALFTERFRAELTLNSIGDAVISINKTGLITYLNAAAETMTGWKKEEAKGKPVADVLKLMDCESRTFNFPHPVLRALETGQPNAIDANTILIRRDGTEIAIEDSIAPIQDLDHESNGAVIVFHDVSFARAITVKMAYLAQHDFLTNLPNRVLLTDRIENAISLAQRHDSKFGIVFLDLDNFKHINDLLGHDVGDKLLQHVAHQLKSCIRSADTVSRLGGDEFIILLSDNVAVEMVGSIADKVRDTLALPTSINGHLLHITVSMGISVYPTDGSTSNILIKNADTAMYSAKEKGRNNYQFFNSAMNARAIERQLIESSLRRALTRREFVLYYQPKVDLKSGKVTGVEALIRWIHPEWGIVLPSRFISIAEECGLIVPIGRWVLREACTQGRLWLDTGIEFGAMAVNISSLEFRQKNFLADVQETLTTTMLPPGYLQVEITESVLMRDAELNNAILQKLKDIGLKLAIDDFGTGYSSLSYLKKFPIDVLKIDQSFINDITDSDQNNGVIVNAIIVMGNSLKQLVVAEGIENDAQLSFLIKRHCGEGQGNFFSPPVTSEQFTIQSANWKSDFKARLTFATR